jgi:DNA-binding GntR family transcriptional regulator
MQEIVEQMRSAADRHDLVGVHELDQQFHQRLWELSDHALLVDVAAQMRSRLNHFFRAAAASLGPDEVRQHAESHQELLDVIASGNVRSAERAMQRHVEAAAKRIRDAGLVTDDEEP